MIPRQHFTAVFERESNDTVSAWIVELPGVYAAADTMKGARSAILEALDAHLTALQALGKTPESRAEIGVVRYERSGTRSRPLRFVGLGALLGKRTSKAKAAAARRNGMKGGRPAASVKASRPNRAAATSGKG